VSTEAWVRVLADGSHAVLLLNRGESAARVEVTWADLGLAAPGAVRDLWERADLGVRREGCDASLPAHAAALLRLSPA